MKLSSTMTEVNYLELNQARELKNHLFELSQEFLSFYNLSHIWVSKYYFDGRYMDITNDLSWKEKLLNHNLYQIFVRNFIEPLKVHNSKPHILYWQSSSTSSDSLLREISNHGVRSGLNVIKVNDDHIENYCFGSSKEILTISHHMPNQDKIEIFCKYLKENILSYGRLKNYILGDTGHRFDLSYETNSFALPYNKKFSSNNHPTLTHRQRECAILLSSGFNTKEIARILELSPRTIETHIEVMKDKLQSKNRVQLISSLNEIL